MARSEEDYWFAPKRYGYGAGLPLTWQAWAATIGFCAAVSAAAWLFAERQPVAFAIMTIAMAAAFLLLCARKTRGGWRWRWGEDD